MQSTVVYVDGGHNKARDMSSRKSSESWHRHSVRVKRVDTMVQYLLSLIYGIAMRFPWDATSSHHMGSTHKSDSSPKWVVCLLGA